LNRANQLDVAVFGRYVYTLKNCLREWEGVDRDKADCRESAIK